MKNDINDNDQLNDQIRASESALTSARIVADLSRDYKNISRLMTMLDKEIGSFTGTMENLNDNVAEFVGLTKLWNEQTKTVHRKIHELQRDTNIDHRLMNSEQQKYCYEKHVITNQNLVETSDCFDTNEDALNFI
jgi:ABC-type transporter Mla subunit MlaD